MLYRIGFIENNGFNLCKFEFPTHGEEGNSILKVKQMYFIPTDNIEFREKKIMFLIPIWLNVVLLLL